MPTLLVYDEEPPIDDIGLDIEFCFSKDEFDIYSGINDDGSVLIVAAKDGNLYRCEYKDS